MDNAREYKCVCTSHAFIRIYILPWVFLVAQTVKNPPAMQETWVWSLGQEDPLEKGMATLSSILAWRIPWIEEPGRLQATGLQRVGHYWMANTFTFIYFYIYRKLWVLTNNSNLVFSVFQLWETQLPEASSIQSLPSSQILRCLSHSPSALTSVLGHTLAQMFSSSIMGSDTLIVHWNTLLCRCPAQLSGCKGYLGWPQLPPLFSPT